MIGLKRFIRPGVVISVIGHVAALMLGLVFVGAGANSFKSMPQDAMLVDIMPPDEAPRYAGTPSELRSSGSETSAQSANDAAQAPPKPTTPSPPQQQRPRSNTQHDRQAKAQPQPQPAQAETTEAEIVSEPPPEETPDQTTTAETFAELALLGGRLGGGFAAPPVGTVQPGYDFTLSFRERVSSCSSIPAGTDVGDKISVSLRVSLNRDGTLASPPQLLRPIASPKERALMEGAIEALQKCQPYTMLPADRYKDWKSIDLTFFPMNFSGG
jgi:hypothetical protein